MKWSCIEEKVPVVTSDGEYTGGFVSRNEVHAREFWHPVVHVWVVNGNGEILLQRRSKDKRQYAGVWHISAAGHIVVSDDGVVGDPKKEAVREAEEELGIKVDAEDLRFLGGVGVSQVVPEEGVMDKEWVNVFLLKVRGVDLGFKLQKDEVQTIKWVSLDEFLKDISDDEKYKEYLNHPRSYYRDTVEKIVSHMRQ